MYVYVSMYINIYIIDKYKYSDTLQIWESVHFAWLMFYAQIMNAPLHSPSSPGHHCSTFWEFDWMC